jgi:DNA-directed RNA polymerase I subunit RPA43
MPEAMSVHSNGHMVHASKSPKSLQKSSGKSSKKRKHESPDDAPSSKKKSKYRDEQGEDGADVVSAEAAQKAKKKQKKEKKRRAREEAQDETTQAESTKTKDAEKKKKGKRKEKEQEPEAATDRATTTEDIELPDAPSAIHAPEASPAPAEPAPELAEDDVLHIEEDQSIGVNLLESKHPTCFYSTRLSLCLLIPAITLPKHARSSILSMHLAPLLLTYFPPAKGIVLAFSDPILSAKPNSAINVPLRPPTGNEDETQGLVKDILSQTSDQFGAVWVWLTATFLVFRPERNDEMYAWTNVSSEGFVGLVSYNYFQSAVAQNRIPADWKWRGPTTEQRRRKRGRKERLRDENGERQGSQSSPVDESPQPEEQSQTQQGDEAGFLSEKTGEKVPETLKYRVVDMEMVPGHEKGKWSLNIEGTLLDKDAEDKLVEEERLKYERMHNKQSATPGLEMSGGLGQS